MLNVAGHPMNSLFLQNMLCMYAEDGAVVPDPDWLPVAMEPPGAIVVVEKPGGHAPWL